MLRPQRSDGASLQSTNRRLAPVYAVALLLGLPSPRVSRLTSSNLALVFPRQEIFEEVAQELQRDILESKCRPVEQLQEVQVILEVSQGGHVLVTKGRVAPVDDVLEVLGGDLSGRNVERQDVEGEVGERQVLPAVPV